MLLVGKGDCHETFHERYPTFGRKLKNIQFFTIKVKKVSDSLSDKNILLL